MKIKIFKGNWNIQKVKSDIDKIYVFGDNDARIGKGGQAIIRDLENSMGIRTKKGPSKKSVAFYTDSDLELNKRKIREDILNIKNLALSKNKTIVLSNGGYGTGLANLKERAPESFNFLNNVLKSYFNFDNERGVSFSKIPGYDEIINSKLIDIKKDTINPVNNTFFKKEALSKGLYTNLDIIKKGFKTAFTSTKEYTNNYLILKENESRIVCEIIDSYKVDILDNKKWSIFEGYSDEFKIDFKLKLYQTHIRFICTLDSSGRMIFNDDLFGDFNNEDLKNKEHKVKGEPIKVEIKEEKEEKSTKNNFSRFKKQNLYELLKKIGIDEFESKFISDKESNFFGLWEVKYKKNNFYFKLKKGIFKNKLKLIFIKNV